MIEPNQIPKRLFFFKKSKTLSNNKIDLFSTKKLLLKLVQILEKAQKFRPKNS